MISVNYDNGNEYKKSSGEIGFEHFAHTYGLPLSRNSAPVALLYGSYEAANKDCFNITVTDSSCTGDFEELIRYSSKIADNLAQEKLTAVIDSLPFISAGRDSVNINLDIFSFIGRCLTGDLELYWKNISESERNKSGRIPLIDVYERVLFLTLMHAFEKLRYPFICKSFWPGKRFAVCLTHDVDEVRKTYQWVTRPLRYIKNRQTGLLKGQLRSLWCKLHGQEPFWTFNEIIKIEEELNVRSSFYFLKERGKTSFFSPATWKLLGRRYDFSDPAVGKVMKQLCYSGWEVGLHGSYNSYYNFEMLEEEKNKLQKSLGTTITGIRQHHLHLDNPKTWEYHEKAGLKYDTTLGFKDRMGFRGGTCLPFHPLSGQKRLKLIEIPLVIMDTPLFKRKCEFLNPDFEKMVNVVSGYNGVLTLLWHHAVFNEYEYPGWSAAYRRIIELCRQKDAWITCAKELYDWWILREKTDFECEYEGTCLKIIPQIKESSSFLNIYMPADMAIKKISGAEVIDTHERGFVIRTDWLKNHECIKVELVGLEHGS